MFVNKLYHIFESANNFLAKPYTIEKNANLFVPGLSCRYTSAINFSICKFTYF